MRVGVREAEKEAQRDKMTVKERRQSIQKRRMYITRNISLRSNSSLVSTAATSLRNRIYCFLHRAYLSLKET